MIIPRDFSTKFRNYLYETLLSYGNYSFVQYSKLTTRATNWKNQPASNEPILVLLKQDLLDGLYKNEKSSNCSHIHFMFN